MTSMRYRLVTLCSVVLALAAGIILGDGPLQGDGAVAAVTGSGEGDRLDAARQQIQEQEQDLAFADTWAAATGAGLVDRKLRGRAVTVVTLPGAQQDTVDRVLAAVGAGGATIASQVALSRNLLDVSQRQMVSELARQMDVGPARKAVQVPADAADYGRVSRLLAYALLTREDGGDQPDKVSSGILAGLSTAGLVTVAGDAEGNQGLARRGSAVVVVGGAPYGSADERAGAGSILGELLGAFDRAGDGTVLTAPTSASAPDGLVTAVRQDPEVARRVSLVDVADLGPGAVLTVLALAADLGGKAGDWGSASAADGPLPGAASR
jgi:hypothetical protein